MFAMQNIALEPARLGYYSNVGNVDLADNYAQKQLRKVEMPSSNIKSWLTLLLVLLAHMVAIIFLVYQHPVATVKLIDTNPMLVSLIAPPAPKLVPIVEPQQVAQVKPVRKLMVKKIRPIETPAERLVEATTEEPKEEAVPDASPVLAPVAEAKSLPKAAPAVEEKIEPPKFGVAYLNNPAPNYPPMARRAGEEGRVLLRVLVSESGAATEVNLEKTSGSERLDQAAMNAVKNWRFIPAKKNNEAFSAYVLVPIKFSLDS